MAIGPLPSLNHEALDHRQDCGSMTMPLRTGFMWMVAAHLVLPA